MSLDRFQNHKPMGRFRQGDNGCESFELTDLYPLKKCRTRGSQRGAGEMINKDIRVSKRSHFAGGDLTPPLTKGDARPLWKPHNFVPASSGGVNIEKNAAAGR